jgi:hypothetical protein
MIGVSILPEIIRSTILSTRAVAKGTMPVSIFIVAPFEQGKTRLALENCAKDSLILTDLTGIGLLEALQTSPQATTVIVNDLSVVTGHKENVNKLTISILNALAEEGTFKIAMPRMSHLDLKGRKVNVIACCVPEVVNDRRNWWYRSGFMSRLLTVRFEHSVSLQMLIHSSIENGNHTEKNVELLKVPQLPIEVHFPLEVSNKISNLSSRVYKEYGETGYRKHKQLRSLAAGHALLRPGGWKNPQVNDSDIDFLKATIPFLVGVGQI